MVALWWIGCVEEPDPDRIGALPSFRPTSEVRFDIRYDGISIPALAMGSGPLNRREGPSCASSFWMPFFTGGSYEPEVAAGILELHFPSPQAGARSLLPTLQDRPLHWVAPQWELEGELSGLFGGTAELTSYGLDKVSVRITDTTLCALLVRGRLDLEIESYAEVVTDCVEVSEVVLEAIAEPPRLFEDTIEEGYVFTDVSQTNAWRNEAGEPFCD